MEPVPIPTTPVQTVLEYAQGEARGSGRAPIPMVARVCGIVGGVVVPLVCFGSSFATMPIRARWQSGEFHDYALLMLSGRNVWPFFPLLAYSMACMVVVCAVPRRRAAGRLWVGFGLWAGVWLALQFGINLLAGLNAMESEPGNLALGLLIYGGVPIGAAVGLHVIFRVLPARWVWAGIVVILIAGAMAAKILNPELSATDVLPAVYLPTLIMGPLWCLEVYVALAILWRRLRRTEREMRALADGGGGRDRGLIVLLPAWCAAYAASWAAAVAQAIRTYHALPTTQPKDCYVATAAARGHRRFVRSREVGGFMVNDQLRRLKCAEIALATLAPRAHRAVRRVYDRVGPVIASGMVHPLLADAAYLTLKPAEGACVWLMRRWVGGFDDLAAGVYGDGHIQSGGEGPHPGPLPAYRARGKEGRDVSADRA